MLGSQAVLWSETLVTRADLEYMLFPRLLAIAQVACSREPRRRGELRDQVAQEVDELGPVGVNVFRSPELRARPA